MSRKTPASAAFAGEPWASTAFGTSSVSLRALAVLILAVCAAVAVTHWPALSAKALWLDDDQYLTRNALVQNPSWTSVRRFLTEVWEPSTVTGYYQPLTMISLMADYALGGRPDDLRPFHRTSLALHVANTGLVILLLWLLFRQPWAAALGGLLFGMHPLTVETIPWITERKTLLATCFALGALCLHVHYARTGKRWSRVAVLAACVLAMLSKPTTTPLPLLMLILDYWPLRRLDRRAVREKVPLLAVAVLSAIITYISQSRTASTGLPTGFAAARIPLTICHNIVFYLSKIAWPAHLSSYYPFPEPLGLANPAVLAGVIGTGLLVGATWLSVRWTRGLVSGGLFFFVALFPTLGVIGFTAMIACDKYVYLPGIGLLLPVTALLARLGSSQTAALAARIRRVVAAVIVLGLATVWAAQTRGYLADWRDTQTLFRYMLRLAPRAPLLLNNYGVWLSDQGRLADALAYYTQAVEQQPDYWIAHVNRGTALRDLGRLDEAVAEFRHIVDAVPGYILARLSLANTLAKQQRLPEAYAEYAEIVRRDPKCSAAYTDWGVALMGAGAGAEAITRLEAALALNPLNAVAQFNLGLAYASLGQPERAVTHYRAAVRLDPKNTRAYTNLGLVLASQGKLPEAADSFRAALAVDPDDALAHLNLGTLAVHAGRPQAAAAHFRAAVALDPNNVEANNNLGTLLAQQGDYAEGLPYLSAAVRLDPRHANAQYMLGYALAALGRFDEAIPHFSRASELQPQDMEACEQLAAAYAAVGRFAEAEQAATRALELARATKDEAALRRLDEQLTQYRAGRAASTSSAPASAPTAP